MAEDPVVPVKLPFVLELGPEKSVERFVYAYVIVGERVCLVDTGVAGSQGQIEAALERLDRSPEDLAFVLNSHEHPDHIGGNAYFRRHTQARFLSHERAVRWIEDLELQKRERPVYGFERLVPAAVKVDRRLREGDVIDLGGVSLEVLFTPGHSPGSVSLLVRPEGTLISADAIPPVGGLPIYADVEASRASLHRLASLAGVRRLYRSHVEEVYEGGAVPRVIQDGLDYLDRVEAAVAEAAGELGPDAAPEPVAAGALERLGVTPPPAIPIVLLSIQAHLRVLAAGEGRPAGEERPAWEAPRRGGEA